MLIKSVEIKRYRSIEQQVLKCDDLTALVGRNGSGKSSFLYAIETFYDVAAPVSQEDFFNRDVGSPIEIRVTFGDLRDEEKEEFKPYIKDDTLIVTKRISSENGKVTQRYYAAALQIPKFAEIRLVSGKKDRIKAWSELVDSGTLTDLKSKAKSSDDVDRFMQEYETAHPELLEAVEREAQFFGPRSIGGGKLDKFTKYVLVPAVREASDEASSKKGAIYQLLDAIVFRKVNSRKDIQEFKLSVEQKVKELYSSENLRELPELGDSISETLKKFAPGAQLNLKWDEVKPPEVQLPSAKATLIEDNFEGEISRKGHGLQRALVVTLLQHLAMTGPTEPLKEDIEEGKSSSEGKVESVKGPDLILAIEEPELYLHPSRSRYLSDLLLQLAERPEVGLGERNQVIYATHSPYFVDLFRFDKIRIVRKDSSRDATVPSSIVTSFTLEEAGKELADVCNEDPAIYTKDSFRAHAMSVMNTIVNEGLFADVVVVVEGVSELGAFWKLQEIKNKNWSELGISIVPAGGKNNIDRPIVIFRGLKIPAFFVFDADAQFKGKKEENEAKNRNHCCLRLANRTVEDFPQTQIHETWAVFKEDMERAIKDDLGEPVFLAIRDKVAKELGYPEPGRILKNIEGASRFVECIYSEEKELPTLEGIIEAITKLGEKVKERA